MPAAVVFAAVAAVLCPRAVTFVDTATGAVAATVTLPGDGLGVFAAPDARVVVPLASEEATVVVDPSGKVERWRGRVFPLFFADFDRMHVVLPGALATLSYPERVPLARVPLPAVAGARRAACSADGRLVVVVPPGPAGSSVTLVAALEGGTATSVRLGGEATAIALAPGGEYTVAADGRGVIEVAVSGRDRPVGALDVGGEVRALALSADGRTVLVGTAGARGGEIVGVRIDVSAKRPLKERFRTPLAGGVTALAAGPEDLVAVAGGAVVVLSRDGRTVRRRVAVEGAADVAVLPTRARSAVPPWSDGRTP